MDLSKALEISASGMKAQGIRLRIIAENMANADSTGETPQDLPYRRKVVTFQNELNRELGIETVGIAGIGVDTGNFQRRYEPGHPSADPEGYVEAERARGDRFDLDDRVLPAELHHGALAESLVDL